MKGKTMAQPIGRRTFGRKSARAGAAAALLALSLAGCINVGPFPSPELERVVVEKSDRWVERNRIALVDISGFIASESGFWTMFGGTSVADVQQKLELAGADSRVRAVVLRINSPGGEASASDVIYQEVLRFKEKTGKPVVAALMGTAASGGYYVALSADRIVASPTTITGSVGVIMDLINMEKLYGKLGLQSVVIKSGEKKDIGSPTRPMTPEEREILQGLNRALFDQFVAVVRERRRGMDAQQLKTVSDGRVVSAQEALQLNLVDRVGYLRDAIQVARELANIESADVILYRAAPSYNSNIYAQASTGLLLEEGLNMLLLRRGPTFLYLWAPEL
jgi:protease-4